MRFNVILLGALAIFTFIDGTSAAAFDVYLAALLVAGPLITFTEAT